MGVTGLWPILAPVKKHRPLSSLHGQTLAVDLSIWVCENQAVRQMQNRVLKPHLRNLFFRISTLLHLGIKPVFVIEGEAPALKHGEMGRRLQVRHGSKTTVSTKRKFCRGRLQGLLKECCDLLDALGVPYIQSQGEAESTCAALNAAGVVDACVSDDGDCFLYGAKVVYRNLTLDSKDPHVESFSMEDVVSKLCLTRERLVALALLLGCDYCPAGVPGVGETWAVRLMTSLASVDVLNRFRQWKRMTPSDCVDSIEAFVWRKASAIPIFPPEKVIEEFLMPKELESSAPPQWQRPCILKMTRVGSRYLEWPETYSLEKALPLVTLWDQLHIIDGSSSVHAIHLNPCRIVKRRVRQGVPCFEVEWENNIEGLVDDAGQPRRLMTLEQENRFQACFPAVVNSFSQLTLQLKEEKFRKSRKARAKKEVDTLSTQLDALTVSSQKCNIYDDVSPDEVLSAVDSFNTDSPEKISSRANDFGSQKNGVRSPGIIDRSVEYVPLSQRLNMLLESEDTCRENTDIIDLDNSYTYVPLSQRLIARLGSQQKTFSSSSPLAASPVTCTEGVGHSKLDHSYTYIPLHQRLKNRLCSRDGVSKSLSSSAESEALQASDSAFDAECVSTSAVMSNNCHRSLTDGGTERQAGRQDTVDIGVLPETSSRTGVSVCKARESGQSVPSGINTVSKSIVHKDNSVPFSDEFHETAAAVPSNQSASGCDLHVSYTAGDQIMETEHFDPAAVEKGCLMKKVPVSQQGKKGSISSQKDKKTISVADLLEDWSDHESFSTDHQNIDYAATASNVKSDFEFSSPDHETQGDHLPGPVQPETNNCVINSPFSHTHGYPENSTPCHSADPGSRLPDNSITPFLKNVPSDWKQTPTLSVDVDSFVSDGHFTLHHTLFTSMEEADESKDTSNSIKQTSDQSTGNTTEAETAKLDPTSSDQSFRHSEGTGATRLDFSTFSSNSSPQTKDQQVCEASLSKSVTFNETSGLNSSSQQASGEAAEQEDGSAVLGEELVARVFNQASALPVKDQCPHDENSLQVADALSDVMQFDNLKQSESIDDECLLSLSQRLRLKQSSVKALSAMTNMSNNTV